MLFLLAGMSGVSAQSMDALGDMKSSGKVFIAADGIRVYKTQAVAQGEDTGKKAAGAYWLNGDRAIAYGIVGGVGVRTGTAFARGSHGNGNGEGHLASPSGFPVITNK